MLLPVDVARALVVGLGVADSAFVVAVAFVAVAFVAVDIVVVDSLALDRLAAFVDSFDSEVPK